VGQSVALVDGHGVGHTVPRVHYNACGAARGVEGQHGLNGHVHGRGVEGLKHDLEGGEDEGGRRAGGAQYLRHLLSVGLGVQQPRVLLGGHTQLVVEGVVPDLLHIVPVGDDAMLDGVLEGQDAPLALRLIPDVAVLLPHAHHDAL
ncbi:hypothetical protein N305_07939, partial [Manacus vitellinus]